MTDGVENVDGDRKHNERSLTSQTWVGSVRNGSCR